MIDGHDRTMIVRDQCEAIVAMIAQRISQDRTSIIAVCPPFDGYHCVQCTRCVHVSPFDVLKSR